MNILGIHIGRNPVAQARTAVEQVIGSPKNTPETFKLCALMFQKQDPGASVRINRKRKKSLMFDTEDYMDIPTALQVADRIELHLKDQYGPGSYQLEFIDAANKHYATYCYNVGGTPTQADVERDGGGGGLGGTKAMSNVLELLTNAKALFGGNGSDSFKDTLLATLVDNIFVEKTTALDQASMIIEVANKLAPQVQAPDATSAIVAGAMPLLATMMQGRQQQGASPQDEQVLKAIMSVMTPEQRAQIGQILSPTQGQAVSGMPVTVPDGSALQREVTAPRAVTEDDQTTALSSLVGPPEGSGVDETPPAASPLTENPYTTILLQMLEQFDIDVSQRAEHQELANKLLSMVQFAQVNLKAEEMPESLRELATQADVSLLPAAFDRFCQTVPSLKTDLHLQLLVKGDLALMLMDADQTDTEGSEIDNVEPTKQPAGGPQSGGDGKPDSSDNGAAAENAANVAHSQVVRH